MTLRRFGSSIQKFKAQNLLKSVLRWSTEKKLRMANYGQSTRGWKTGFTSQSQKDRVFGLSEYTVYCMIIFILFQISFIFAAPINDICIGSHNLHGFKKSGDYHRQCIQTHNGIWFSQELWLQQSQLSQLNQLGFQFVARSGMEHATSAGMLRGRPFGGVGIAWSHDLDHVILSRTFVINASLQSNYSLKVTNFFSSRSTCHSMMPATARNV